MHVSKVVCASVMLSTVGCVLMMGCAESEEEAAAHQQSAIGEGTGSSSWSSASPAPATSSTSAPAPSGSGSGSGYGSTTTSASTCTLKEAKWDDDESPSSLCAEETSKGTCNGRAAENAKVVCTCEGKCKATTVTEKYKYDCTWTTSCVPDSSSQKSASDVCKGKCV